MPEPERLQKVLARAGLGSRRVCDDLIAAGRVAVDGATATLGMRVDRDAARITVDGTPVTTRAGVVYYLLNKPARVVTTAADPQGRPTVVDLVPSEPRVFPVGRLDYDTEGLLLLTNDGNLAQVLTHPSHGIEKTYLAEIEGNPTPATVRALSVGVELDDGPTAPARARVVQQEGQRAALELTIHEGRNRQVRRMCEAVGHPVRRLVRVGIGPLRVERLAPGDWRLLEPAEVRALYEAGAAPASTSEPDAAAPE